MIVKSINPRSPLISSYQVSSIAAVWLRNGLGNRRCCGVVLGVIPWEDFTVMRTTVMRTGVHTELICAKHDGGPIQEGGANSSGIENVAVQSLVAHG